jgi:L-fucose isomerase
MRPKVGLITISIPQEISPLSPKSRKTIMKYAESAISKLKKNLDVIRVDEFIENNTTALKVSEHLRKENVDCVIFQIGAWPSPALAIDVIDKLNKKIPIIVWAFDDLEVLSLVPACQFHGAFDDMGIAHEFIYTNPDDENFTLSIEKITSTAAAVKKLNGMNLGLFGGRYMHMYTGTADPLQVKKVFGVEITHINEFCLVEEAKKVSRKKIEEYYEYLRNTYGKITAPLDMVEKSIRLYLAMKKLKTEYDLDFASVKCMLEVQGSYCSHCLSVSKNIDEGFIVSCEGDINGAITMQLLKLLSKSAVGFGDICKLDMEKNILTLVNCGAFATNFAEKPEEVTFPEQLKTLAPGPGTGMTTSFICKPGKVTIARLGRINREYVMQISSGNAVKRSNDNLINDIMPHIFIHLDSDDADSFIQNSRSNHLHWVYGDYKEQLRYICKILKIKDIVC